VAVPVHDSGDLVVTTDAARRTLAELGAHLGGDLLGHALLSSYVWPTAGRGLGCLPLSAPGTRTAPRPEAPRPGHSRPGDHGTPRPLRWHGLPRRGNAASLDSGGGRGRITEPPRERARRFVVRRTDGVQTSHGATSPPNVARSGARRTRDLGPAGHPG